MHHGTLTADLPNACSIILNHFSRDRSHLSLDLSLAPQSESLLLTPKLETKRMTTYNYDSNISSSNYVDPSSYKVYFRNVSLPESNDIPYTSPTIDINIETPRRPAYPYNMNNSNSRRDMLSPESRRNLYQKSRFAHNLQKAEEYVKRTNVRRLSKDLTDTIDSIREIITDVRNRLRHNSSEDSWANIPYISQQANSSSQSQNGKNKTTTLSVSCDVSLEKDRHSCSRESPVVEEHEKVVKRREKSDRQVTGTCDRDNANKPQQKDSILSLKKQISSGSSSSDRQILLSQSTSHEDQSDLEASESSFSSEHTSLLLREEGLDRTKKSKKCSKAENKSGHHPSKLSNSKSKRSNKDNNDNTPSQSIHGSVSCSKLNIAASGNKSLEPSENPLLSARTRLEVSGCKNKSVKTNDSLHASSKKEESKSSCSNPKKASSMNSSRRNPGAFDDVEVEVTRGGNCSPDRDNCSEYALRHPKRNLGTRSLSSDTAPEEKAGKPKLLFIS